MSIYNHPDGCADNCECCELFDVEVERELIREANERKSALTQLREALEQIRINANRINKATWLWRNDGHN